MTGRTTGRNRRIAWLRTALAGGVAAVLVCQPGAWVAAEKVAAASEDEQPEQFTQVATVDSNLDAESLLNRANEYIGQEQYREALLLLQHVLDEYGGSLTRDRFGVYVPARRAVEGVIASLGAEGLAAYRLSADGEARALVGGDPAASRDAEALGEVVERYFVSSVGDDAAFTLGCLLAERGEFGRAAYLFRRVLEDYPEPTVDRTALRARLAMALARGGAVTAAKAEANRLTADPATTDAIRRYVASAIDASSQPVGPTASDAWLMAWGSPDRGSVMPALDIGKLVHNKGVLALLWKRQHPLRAGERTWGGFSSPYARQMRQSRPGLIGRWASHNWLPNGQAVYRDGRVYYKTYNAVVCRDAETGREIWSHQHATQRDKTGINQNVYYSYQSSGLPATPTSIEEVLLFGDRVGRSVSLIGDRIYHIGDHQLAGLPNDYQRRAGQSKPLRVGNTLVALDAKTGQSLWRRGRTADKTDTLAEVRFLAAPVPGDEGVITAVEREGEVYLINFDDRGQVRWEQFLCARPAVPAPRWYATALTVADDRVYVLPGEGLVFAASRRDGSLIWATAYERSVPQQVNYWQARTGFGRSNGVKGWPENALFVRSGVVAAAPWDAEAVVLLDEQTGRPARRPDGAALPAQRVSQPGHCVGMIGDRLVYYAANQLTAMDVTTGAIAWRSPVGKVTGRAAITANAIYVPVGEHVLQLDPARDGKLVAKVRCVTPFGDPVGNLYCDGRRLLATGADQVYALVEGEAYLASLNERIERDDTPGARLARAQLSEQLGRREQAEADYRAVFERAGDEPTKALARRSLVDALLADAGSGDGAMRRLTEAQALSEGTADAPRVRFALARHLETANPAEAMAIYLDLTGPAGGESPDAALIGLGDALGGWRVVPSALASERIDGLLAADDGTLAAVIDQRAGEALAAAESLTQPGPRFKALGRVALSYPRTPSVIAALQQMRHFDPLVGFETAESTLERLARVPHEPSAAAATAALAELYLWKGMDRQARDTWHAYARRFADLPVGTELEPKTGEQLAGERLAAIDADPVPAVDMPAPPWKRLWELRGSGAHTLNLPGTRDSQFHNTHVLLLTNNRRSLRCYPTADASLNRPVWQVDVPQFVANRINPYNQTTAFPGVAGGNVIVFRDQAQLLAYGLISGKLLWRADADKLDNNYRNVRAYSYNANQGMQRGLNDTAVDETVMLEHVVTEQFIDQVVARDAVTGRVLWRRSFDELSVDGVYAGHGRAVIVTGNGELLACDPYTGRLAARVQLDGRAANAPLVFAPRHVMYQVGSDAVCIDLASGNEAWRHPCQGPGRFGVIGPGRAFVIDHQRNLHLLPMGDGSEAVKIPVERFDLNADSVALSPDGGEVYCVGYDNQRNRVLAVVNAETGQRVTRISFGRNYAQNIPAETYARCGEFLPWVDRVKNDKGNYTGQVELQFYRKSDGKKYTDHTLPSRLKGSKFQYIYRPPTVIGGTLIVATHQGVEAFGTDAPKPQPQPAADAPPADAPQDAAPEPASAADEQADDGPDASVEQAPQIEIEVQVED